MRHHSILAAIAALALACTRGARTEQVLTELPLDSLDQVIGKTGVTLDPAVSFDGRGSLRLAAAEPTTFRVAELAIPPVDGVRLIYRARVRSEDVRGKAYLEMWCAFPGQGEFFSRALQSPLSGTNDWTTQETPFFLQKGQVPSRVKLNLVVEGTGTVWLDQVVLAEAPL
jgi:hypothetical protein